MYTPFAHAFAYAINKTPYVILYWFSVKITLCMDILCVSANNTTISHVPFYNKVS